MKFSYRRYQDGDAEAINELYFQVTGRCRSVEEHAWQWLQSPAGESEMWLIEMEGSSGAKTLIGHHGVMAMDFTYHGKSVCVGKTENTMVLPEYRDKLLYPRYEKTFLTQYQERFHALFSTMGPAAAIRLRQVMGYEFRQGWVGLYIGNEPFLSIDHIRERCFGSSIDLANKLATIGIVNLEGVKISCIDTQSSSFDFDAYWSKVSHRYGLTPARTRANLKWRFWDNPYVIYQTILIDDSRYGLGIAIISTTAGYVLQIADVFCEKPAHIGCYIQTVSRWAAKYLGFRTMHTTTTTDSLNLFDACRYRRHTWIYKVLKRNQCDRKPKMPRKVTALGISAGIDPNEGWFVTPFYFEGRN